MLTLLNWRIIGIAGLLLAIGGGFWYVQHLQDKANRVPILEAQLTVLRESLERQAEHNRKVQTDYEAELQTLRDAALQPVSIRVCRAAISVPAIGNPTGQFDGPAAPAAVLPEEAARDIGPALDAEFRRCDEISAQLRALQAWVTNTD